MILVFVALPFNVYIYVCIFGFVNIFDVGVFSMSKQLWFLELQSWKQKWSGFILSKPILW